MPKKLTKSKGSKATAPTPSSKIPTPKSTSSSSSSSPIQIRSSGRAAAPQTSSQVVTGETSTTDNGSLRASSIARSQSSSSLQPSTPPNLATAPAPSSSSTDFSPPTASQTTSIDSTLPSTSAFPVLNEEEEAESSVLNQLRKQMEMDEEKRREQAALAAAKEEKDKDKDKPRRKLVRKSHHRRGEGSIDAGSIFSYDETEEDVAPTPEPAPQSQPTPSLPPAAPSAEHMASLAVAPPAPSQPAADPTYYLLALPRFLLLLTLSTFQSLALLPLTLASHLPLIGSHIPCHSPRQSSITFAPPPPPSSSSRAGSARREPREEQERKGLAWQAAELGLGLTLAGVLVAGAGVSVLWQGVRGGTSRSRRAKGKGKAE